MKRERGSGPAGPREHEQSGAAIRGPTGRRISSGTRYLALDVGDRRIGLAAGDEGGEIARPLRTLRRRGMDADVAAIGDVARREGVSALLIGLPLTLRGEEGPQAARVRRFADACGALGLPVELYDERFTTSEARLRGAPDVDAGAATILLEDFLRARGRA